MKPKSFDLNVTDIYECFYRHSTNKNTHSYFLSSQSLNLIVKNIETYRKSAQRYVLTEIFQNSRYCKNPILVSF